MVEKTLYFVENEEALTPFNSLAKAVEKYDNFMDFVIEKKEIQSLTKNDEAEEAERWKISVVPIDKVAQAFKER